MEVETDISKLILAHPAGFVKTPDNIDEIPNLALSAKKSVLPRCIDERHRLTKGRNQYDKPECAGFGTSAFAEYVLWKKNDYPTEVDPHKIYAHAKKIDGLGGGEGTSLTAAMQALLDLGYFDPKVCYVGVLRTIEEVKYAIHKFGVCTVGLNICEEFYLCNPNRPYVNGDSGRIRKVGGHGLLGCGYDTHSNGETDFYVSNSWGCSLDTGGEWGMHGTAVVSSRIFADEFLYGSVLCNCYNDMAMGTRV